MLSSTIAETGGGFGGRGFTFSIGGGGGQAINVLVLNMYKSSAHLFWINKKIKKSLDPISFQFSVRYLHLGDQMPSFVRGHNTIS